MLLRLSFFLGIAVSLSCHFALAALFPPDQHELSGGDIVGEVALGQSFANLAVGVIDGNAKPQEQLPHYTAQPDVLKPIEVRRVSKPELTSTTTPAAAMKARAAPSDLYLPSQKEDQVVNAPSLTQTVSQMTPVKTAVAVQNVIKAVDPAKPTPVKTPKDPVPKKAMVKAKPAPKGNAKVTAAVGQTTGKARAKQADATKAKKTVAKRSGHGAEKSYQSNVLRRVARSASRERAGSSGTVRLDLKISPSGALSGVSVAAKSGNPRVDQAAARAAKKAGPFGATPSGRPMVLRVKVNVKG